MKILSTTKCGLSLLAATIATAISPAIHAQSMLLTSFEEPGLGGKYTDLGNQAVDHELVNNAGQAIVSYAGNNELGFRSFYVNTRGSSGITDGDFIGVSNYTGSGVGSYTEGTQGYQLSDTDGFVRVELETIDMSLVTVEPNLLVDLFVQSTGWESGSTSFDIIRVWVETDIGTIDLLNTTGTDIDDLGIEGFWQTYSADLTGASTATIKFSLDSNSGSEAIFVDNIRLGEAPIVETISIMEIQGDSQESPYASKRVITEGIVTAVTTDGQSFWIQDPIGDNDAATSDGIYVFESDVIPSIGDHVIINGSISEYSRSGDLPVTQIVGATTIVESSENTLPSPIIISDMPNESIPEAIAFLESIEGMRVELEFAQVVGQTNKFGEFFVIAPDDIVEGSGFSTSYSQMIIRSLGDESVDYNPERILIDDTNLPVPLDVMPGDSLESAVGVMHYAYSNYRLLPVQISSVEVNQVPTTFTSISWWYSYMQSIRNRRYLNIASLNTENLFDLIDNPDKSDQGSTPTAEELETKISKLAATIGLGLKFPEVIAVQEVENQTILAELANAINQKMRNRVSYKAISIETSDRRGIETGYLYDSRRIKLVDYYQMDDSHVAGVSNAFGPTATSPGREPLIAVFEHRGIQTTLVNNHFKSKGGDGALYGVTQPATRESEIVRKQQAQVVRRFVESLLGEDPNTRLIVLGDLNDFQFGEPGEGSDDPLTILRGDDSATPLTNLVDTKIPEESRFTYLYQGNSQVLDHFLISKALDSKIIDAEIVHINASFLDEYMEDTSVLERSSDHDPILVKIGDSHRSRSRYRR